MSITLQAAMLLAVGLYFFLLLRLLKKKSLNLKYTLLWIFSGILMLVLALFPGLLSVVAKLIGVYAPTNALFALILFCVIMILMSLTAIVSKLNERVKRLSQAYALLEKRVREQKGNHITEEGEHP